MWPTAFALLKLAGVPLQTSLPSPAVGGDRRRLVAVDGSSALRTHQPASADALVAHLQRTLGAWSAHLGLVTFDTAPFAPCDAAPWEPALEAERRLPPIRRPDVSAGDLTAAELAAHAAPAALDGSLMLQWQWQHKVLLPALAAAAPAHWPPGGVVLDAVVLEAPPATLVSDERDRTMRSENVDDVLAEMHGDYRAILGRLVPLQMAVKRFYKRCLIGGSGAPAPPQLLTPVRPAPYAAVGKLLANVDAWLRMSPQHETVLVVERPDALLFVLAFLEHFARTQALEPGRCWLVLPSAPAASDTCIVMDAGQALGKLQALAAARLGHASTQPFDQLMLLLALARGNETLGAALWSTLAACDDLPRAPLFRLRLRCSKRAASPVVAQPPLDCTSRADTTRWLQAAHEALVPGPATGLLDWYARLRDSPNYHAALSPQYWAIHAELAHYRLATTVRGAWTTDGNWVHAPTAQPWSSVANAIKLHETSDECAIGAMLRTAAQHVLLIRGARGRLVIRYVQLVTDTDVPAESDARGERAAAGGH